MRLQAWIDDYGDRGHMAAFISEDTLGERQPAMRMFPTREEARQWIEAEAGELGVEVQWPFDPEPHWLQAARARWEER